MLARAAAPRSGGRRRAVVETFVPHLEDNLAALGGGSGRAGAAAARGGPQVEEALLLAAAGGFLGQAEAVLEGGLGELALLVGVGIVAGEALGHGVEVERPLMPTDPSSGPAWMSGAPVGVRKAMAPSRSTFTPRPVPVRRVALDLLSNRVVDHVGQRDERQAELVAGRRGRSLTRRSWTRGGRWVAGGGVAGGARMRSQDGADAGLASATGGGLAGLGRGVAFERGAGSGPGRGAVGVRRARGGLARRGGRRRGDTVSRWRRVPPGRGGRLGEPGGCTRISTSSTSWAVRGSSDSGSMPRTTSRASRACAASDRTNGQARDRDRSHGTMTHQIFPSLRTSPDLRWMARTDARRLRPRRRHAVSGRNARSGSASGRSAASAWHAAAVQVKVGACCKVT